MSNPKRNAPCPCGSGRKYKHCCGKITPSSEAKNSSDINTLYRSALRFHKQGNYRQAEALYRQIISLQANHADAHHLLGALALQAKRLPAAYQHITRAISYNPNQADYHLNLGLVLTAQQRDKPALLSFRRALQLNPKLATACFHSAVVHNHHGDIEAAISGYRQTLELQPDYAEAHLALGNLLQAQGQLEAALQHYQQALQQQPKFMAIRNNIGNTLVALGRSSEAIEQYQLMLEQQPQSAELYYNLGNAYTAQNQLDQAINCYQQALEIRSDYPQVHNNLGNAYFHQGKLTAAANSYRDALEIRADYREALDNLIDTQLKSCDWSELDSMAERLLQPVLQNPDTILPPRPFLTLRLPQAVPAADLQTIARITSNRRAQALLRHVTPFTHPAPRNSAKPQKLRLAYVSTDFYEHATAYLIKGLFALHDRDRFSVYSYSLGKDDNSIYRQAIAADSDLFCDARQLSSAALAQRIYDDKIDILIDLNSHSGANRIETFALRPAPIQINYLAFPGTSGADFFDYIITDAIVTPTTQQRFFDEHFVTMPHSYQINDNHRVIAATPASRATCGLPDTSFVFCCFNNHYKIEPLIFTVWMNILKRVTDSVLWLLGGNSVVIDNLRREAEQRGVAGERLVFAQRLPVTEHLARHQHADLFLDTHYYNAHTTASDALWTGLPVLTCPGENFTSRVAQSLLYAVDLPELVVTDFTAYEDQAVALSQNPTQLQQLKQHLTNNRQHAPLFDTARFVHNLEQAYEQMWEIYQRGAATRPITVTEK